ncbi:hypothetical protein [Nocardia xishanensis]|uniref:hypothetical protein n=1 Tax=Nocardia xishanensis TaxID=238964 RepID=UPI00082F1990|nr:hypothetical protein [Nocardia xishanensis]
MKTRPPSVTGGQITPEIVVRVRAASLRKFTRKRQFDQVAVQHGFTDSCSFERFVTALLDVAGVDYEGLRQVEAARRTVHRRLVAMARRGPRLMLWSAATMDAFIVCRADGRVIWHDHFPPDCPVASGIAAAETSARQAIWLAGQARVHWGAEAATLHLILARSRGVELIKLHHAAVTAALVLDVVTDPVHNPAAEQCTHPTVVDWHRTDLGALIHSPRESA